MVVFPGEYEQSLWGKAIFVILPCYCWYILVGFFFNRSSPVTQQGRASSQLPLFRAFNKQKLKRAAHTEKRMCLWWPFGNALKRWENWSILPAKQGSSGWKQSKAADCLEQENIWCHSVLLMKERSRLIVYIWAYERGSRASLLRNRWSDCALETTSGTALKLSFIFHHSAHQFLLFWLLSSFHGNCRWALSPLPFLQDRKAVCLRHWEPFSRQSLQKIRTCLHHLWPAAETKLTTRDVPT